MNKKAHFLYHFFAPPCTNCSNRTICNFEYRNPKFPSSEVELLRRTGKTNSNDQNAKRISHQDTKKDQPQMNTDFADFRTRISHKKAQKTQGKISHELTRIYLTAENAETAESFLDRINTDFRIRISHKDMKT